MESKSLEEKSPIEKTCLNCGTSLPGRFCPNCGQDSQDFRKSVWKVFFQFFETFTDFDNKVWSSLGPLLFRPGYLTKKFFEGKRKQFLNPIQMYAFFSFLFFLIAFYIPENGLQSDSKEFVNGFVDGLSTKEDSARARAKAKADSLKLEKKLAKNDMELEFGELGNSVAKYDSTQRALPPEERDGFFERSLVRKFIIINQRIKQKDKSIIPSFVEEFKGNLPNLLILLLPFFALILKILYIKKNFFYVEHLVLSIHLHCFAFLLFSVFIIAKWILPGVIDDMSIPFLILLLYVYLSLKNIFKQTWIKTFVKFNFLGFVYSMSLLIGFVINIFVAALLID